MGRVMLDCRKLHQRALAVTCIRWSYFRNKTGSENTPFIFARSVCKGQSLFRVSLAFTWRFSFEATNSWSHRSRKKEGPRLSAEQASYPQA